MKRIHMESWPRREAFALFSQMAFPFYSVTIPVDVTRVRAFARARGLSFYCLMIWLCTAAVNQVPALRQRIRGDAVVELERTDPSFTTLERGAEQFRIVTLPWEADAACFCAHAAERTERQKCFIDPASECDGLIFFSCAPWFDFTGMTNGHSGDRDDTSPRITWGKYYEERGRLWVHMAVEVNHRTVDGLHIARMKDALDRAIAALEISE